MHEQSGAIGAVGLLYRVPHPLSVLLLLYGHRQYYQHGWLDRASDHRRPPSTHIHLRSAKSHHSSHTPTRYCSCHACTE